jgi:hypothetical protein
MELTWKHFAGVMAGGLILIGIANRFTSAPPSPAPAAQPTHLSGADLCKRDLTRFVQFKDPGSVQVLDVARGNDLPDGSTSYDLTVNAKNSFGAFTGGQVVNCIVNEREQRVVSAG